MKGFAVEASAHWRCAEPVLLLESDDWGLERRASSERLSALGEPGERADEETETADDLRSLFDVLNKHRDPTGRPAALTANFIVANPDHEAIARDRYDAYHETTIDTRDDLRAPYREGLERRVFTAELHGRRHFSVDEWMADLRRDVPGARRLSREGHHGGLSLLKDQTRRYHTEYVNWRTGIEPAGPALAGQLKESLDVLERLFGRRPSSTIAPHYVFSLRIARAWREAGLRFIQGSNFHVLRGDGREYGGLWISHAMGEKGPEGLRYLRRSVRFEPRPERTHRMNYTGRYRRGGLEALDELLGLLRPLGPRFLTTAELGEAIERGGSYRDAFTGSEQSLTPIDPVPRRALRAAVALGNAWRSTKAWPQNRPDGVDP